MGRLIRWISKGRTPTLGLVALVLGALALAPTPAQGQGVVEMELATDAGFPALQTRDWLQTLTEAGVQGLQIRSSRPGDQPRVEEFGAGAARRYRVMGVIDRDGVLRLPGGKRFRRNDRNALKSWIDELSKWGPQGAPAGKPAFGLDADQVESLMDDIGRASGVASTELGHDEVARRLIQALRHRVEIQEAQLAGLERYGPVGVDLQELALGTSLAYVLRPAGLVWYPDRLPSGEVRLRVTPSAQAERFWPAGSEPDGRDVDAVPTLMEFINVEIDPTPVMDVVEPIRKRLNVPLLIDRNQLVKHGIELDKVQVSHPKRRSYYKKILSTLLGPAGLRIELRIDDGNRPFLWLTSLRP